MFFNHLNLLLDGVLGLTHLAPDLLGRVSFGAVRHGVACEVSGGVRLGWRGRRRVWHAAAALG